MTRNQWIAVLVFLAVAIVSVATVFVSGLQRSRRSVAEQKVASQSQSAPANQAGSTLTLEFTPPALTADQLVRNEEITSAVKETKKSFVAEVSRNFPAWVAEQYREYEGRDYTFEKAAFQRSVGWGTGTYQGRPFYWFAYTNTDAFLQYDFSIGLAPADMERIIGGRKDGYGRPREARGEAGAWIGDTNDWTDIDCVRPNFDPCNIGASLERSVADLNKDLPDLNLAIKGKLPW